MNSASSSFQLTYEISPIILTGGAAQDMPGGMIPIVSLTEGLNFTDGIMSGGTSASLDDFFAHFVPIVGADLIKQKLGEYPFANQAVAANAVITDPLQVSLRMICPARGPGGYSNKQATMTALQSAIAQHNVNGGTYTIITPTYTYTNCVMLGLRDITANPSAQPQTEWQWDFRQPLLTQAQADQAQNNLMSKISGGTQLPMDNQGGLPWSGLTPTVGNPSSLAGSSLVGSAQNLGGALNQAPFAQASSLVGSLF